ncbi:MAG TPA: hypothetical protein VF543_22175 [Pyrinomonadaceae bacterium]|jgi:hypothetical protein
MERYQLKMNLLLLLPVLVTSLAGCSRPTASVQRAQTQNSQVITTTNGGGIAPTPDPTHGKAAGELQPFNPTSEDWQASLSTHPAPNVWLVFPATMGQEQPQDTSNGRSASTIKVELPPKAKEVLVTYWKYLLTIRPNTDLIDIGNALNRARNELQKIRINAPSGWRVISWDEAESLVDFVDSSFHELMEQVRKYRSGFPTKSAT